MNKYENDINSLKRFDKKYQNYNCIRKYEIYKTNKYRTLRFIQNLTKIKLLTISTNFTNVKHLFISI